MGLSAGLKMLWGGSGLELVISKTLHPQVQQNISLVMRIQSVSSQTQTVLDLLKFIWARGDIQRIATSSTPQEVAKNLCRIMHRSGQRTEKCLLRVLPWSEEHVKNPISHCSNHSRHIIVPTQQEEHLGFELALQDKDIGKYEKAFNITDLVTNLVAGQEGGRKPVTKKQAAHFRSLEVIPHHLNQASHRLTAAPTLAWILMDSHDLCTTVWVPGKEAQPEIVWIGLFQHDVALMEITSI